MYATGGRADMGLRFAKAQKVLQAVMTSSRCSSEPFTRGEG